MNNIFVCRHSTLAFIPAATEHGVSNSQAIGVIIKDDLVVEIMVTSPWVLCFTKLGLCVVHCSAIYPRKV